MKSSMFSCIYNLAEEIRQAISWTYCSVLHCKELKRSCVKLTHTTDHDGQLHWSNSQLWNGLNWPACHGIIGLDTDMCEQGMLDILSHSCAFPFCLPSWQKLNWITQGTTGIKYWFNNALIRLLHGYIQSFTIGTCWVNQWPPLWH